MAHDDALMESLKAHADEQVRDVFKRLPGLNAESVAKVVHDLMGHSDWRARAEGVKLRARIAGDFAPDVVTMTPSRAEDLGGMDAVFQGMPPEMLAALVKAVRKKDNGEE